MPGWRQGGSQRGCSCLREGPEEERGAPHRSHPAPVSSWEALPGEGACRGGGSSSVKCRIATRAQPEVPVLQWLYSDWEIGKQKERRSLVNSSSFCQVKNRQKVRAMLGDTKMPLSSSRKRMGRKIFSFPLACSLPSPPKDIQHEGQCSCQSSLDGSSPLQQHFSCFNKLICQSDIRSLKKRSSGNSITTPTDGNAVYGFHTPQPGLLGQVAAYRLDPKLLHRPGAGLARPTTPPVSHLPKELLSEAAFFSE